MLLNTDAELDFKHGFASLFNGAPAAHWGQYLKGFLSLKTQAGNGGKVV